MRVWNIFEIMILATSASALEATFALCGAMGKVVVICDVLTINI